VTREAAPVAPEPEVETVAAGDVGALRAEVAALRPEVAALRAEVAELRAEVAALRTTSEPPDVTRAAPAAGAAEPWHPDWARDDV
jgi:phage shock protein A